MEAFLLRVSQPWYPRKNSPLTTLWLKEVMRPGLREKFRIRAMWS
jgi:hypothetical protein